MNKIKILRQFQMHDNVKLISTVKAKWLSKSYQEKFKKAIYLKYKEEEDDIEYWRKNVYIYISAIHTLDYIIQNKKIVILELSL